VIRPSQFEIHTQLEDGTGRLTVVGELDLATVGDLQDRAQSLLEQSASRLILDLSQMSFIDSSGLRLLISLSARAEKEEWTLGLVRPDQRAFSVFEISGVDQKLPFIEDPN